MGEEFKVVTAPIVQLFVTSNLNSFGSERRFQKSLTISELKNKLELLTGASASGVTLELYDKSDQLLTRIEDDNALLGSLPVEDGMRIHVNDPTHRPGEFEDTSKVEKFVLPDDEYNKRNDSVRSFLKRNKFGKYAEGSEEDLANKKQEQEALEQEKELAKTISVDQRCEVSIPGQLVRRGTVAFVGEVHFKPGWWVGVKYDEPMGKNDGSVDGKRYFECRQKYGGFVKPSNVVVGDFPEELLDLDEEL